MKHVHVIEKSGTLVRKYKDASSDTSETYSISVLMICVLASSAVDRGFEPLSHQNKDDKTGICCFSAKHAALRSKRKN